MRTKRFLFFFCAPLIIAAFVTLLLAPVLVASGLRLWIAWAARQEGVRVDVQKIDAPFLRAVTLSGLRIESAPGSPFHVAATAARIEADLHLAGLFSRSRGRVLRSLGGTNVRVNVRREKRAEDQARSLEWRIFETLLADNIGLAGMEIHVEDGASIVDLHDGRLTASEIESGVFEARAITIASPVLHKTFAQLRGATSWQNERLTIAAVTLAPGLDLDTVTFDLSRLRRRYLGFEMNLDAFGGKLRASVSSEDAGKQRTWDVAGTASNISLAQMSDSLDLTSRTSGSLRGCKFTFRGAPGNLENTTASIWAELAEFTWRDRTADTIMIGASLYNRELQIEQLYVKQHANQLTVSGEAALPRDWANGPKADFRGDISASIDDLGNFARLFGGRPSDFSGGLAVNGTVDAHADKLVGQLTAAGRSLLLFGAPVESFEAKLTFRDSQLVVERLDFQHQDDFLRATGSVNLFGTHAYAGTLTSSIGELSDYGMTTPRPFGHRALGGNLLLNWRGNGNSTAHSGSFEVRGTRLHPLDLSIAAFDAELEAEYSPESMFFRQFHLASQQADLSAFVTLAKNYCQLQTLRLDLNGKTKLHGNVFVPVSVSKLRTDGDWLAALSDDPNFDVDLTLDPIDFAELATALTAQPKLSGHATARLETYGTPASLEAKIDLYLQNFAIGTEPAISVNLSIQLEQELVRWKSLAVFAQSNPATIDASIPFRLLRRDTHYVANTDGEFSAALEFPAIFLRKAPRYLSRGILVDGILSGQLVASDNLQHPRVTGEVQLVDGKLPATDSISSRVTFRGDNANIDFLHFTRNNLSYSANGEIDFRDLSRLAIELTPSTPLLAASFLDPEDCVNDIQLSPAVVTELQRPEIVEVDFRGGLFARDWILSLRQQSSLNPPRGLSQSSLTQTFSFCHDADTNGKTLTLAIPGSRFP